MEGEKQFVPRKSFKASILFGSAALFIAAGSYVLSKYYETDWVFYIVCAVSVVFVLSIVLIDGGMGRHYAISKEGIQIKFGYRDELIAKESIADISILDSKSTSVLVSDFQLQFVELYKSKGDTGRETIGGVLFELIQYATTGIKIDKSANAEAGLMTVEVDGDFVMISLSARIGFLISPKDPEDFVNTYRKIHDS